MGNNIYFRKENGELGVVTYDDHAVALEMAKLPAKIISDMRTVRVPKEQMPKARTAFLVSVK